MATKKTEIKETVKNVTKAPAKTEVKAPVKAVQFAGNEATEADIIDKVKAAYVAEGHKESAIKEINLYVKPEEYAVYYVINDKSSGKVNLF